jgi:hypothetical protein
VWYCFCITAKGIIGNHTFQQVVSFFLFPFYQQSYFNRFFIFRSTMADIPIPCIVAGRVYPGLLFVNFFGYYKHVYTLRKWLDAYSLSWLKITDFLHRTFCDNLIFHSAHKVTVSTRGDVLEAIKKFKEMCWDGGKKLMHDDKLDASRWFEYYFIKPFQNLETSLTGQNNNKMKNVSEMIYEILVQFFEAYVLVKEFK